MPPAPPVLDHGQSLSNLVVCSYITFCMRQGCLHVGGSDDKPRVIIYVTLDESLKKLIFFLM